MRLQTTVRPLAHQPASPRLSHRPALPAPTRCGWGILLPGVPALLRHAAMATGSRPLCSGPPASAGLTVLSLELPCRKPGLMAKGLHLDITATARSPYRCRLCHLSSSQGRLRGLPHSCPKGEAPRAWGPEGRGRVA